MAGAKKVAVKCQSKVYYVILQITCITLIHRFVLVFCLQHLCHAFVIVSEIPVAQQVLCNRR